MAGADGAEPAIESPIFGGVEGRTTGELTEDSSSLPTHCQDIKIAKTRTQWASSGRCNGNSPTVRSAVTQFNQYLADASPGRTEPTQIRFHALLLPSE